jgi:hypothetical protein
MGETTELIHKRIRNWKTTTAGVAVIVCPIVAIFCPPDLAMKVMAAGNMLGGLGLVAARDAKPHETVVIEKK